MPNYRVCSECGAPATCTGSAGKGWEIKCQRAGCSWGVYLEPESWKRPPRLKVFRCYWVSEGKELKNEPRKKLSEVANNIIHSIL